jgi:hypothetical protein
MIRDDFRLQATVSSKQRHGGMRGSGGETRRKKIVAANVLTLDTLTQWVTGIWNQPARRKQLRHDTSNADPGMNVVTTDSSGTGSNSTT